MWSNQAPNSITIPPGQTQRIVIDNNGIIAYNSTNVAIWQLVYSNGTKGPSIIVGVPGGTQVQIFSSTNGGTVQWTMPVSTAPGFLNQTIGAAFIEGAVQNKNSNSERAQLTIWAPQEPNVPGLPAAITLLSESPDNTLGKQILLQSDQIKLFVDNLFGIQLISTLGFQIGNTGIVPAANQTSFQLGNSSPSLNYYEEWVPDGAQVIASAASITTLTNLGQRQINNDYNVNTSQMNLATGIWTPPALGVYYIHFSFAFAAWVTPSRFLMAINRNGTATANQLAEKDYSNNSGRDSMGVQIQITALTDTIRFAVGQVTAANQSPSSGDQRSFMSIRKVLTG